ncbi:hypothetical protein T265_09540 [Opisthorchis viverrini]|uniref:Uncharacterized protein n=1 Tax=Opisthorchis viverrini TaxID=6198 RepID=A0A074Z5J0_OPIVI|nr:hypothetical protein T265_09540 [Opisthorchis viverrini]KER22343.1 hypothetical protein T265_09540 [Opisthorchis viverrini]
MLCCATKPKQDDSGISVGGDLEDLEENGPTPEKLKQSAIFMAVVKTLHNPHYRENAPKTG